MLFLLREENESIGIGHVLSSCYIEAENCWQYRVGYTGCFFLLFRPENVPGRQGNLKTITPQIKTKNEKS